MRALVPSHHPPRSPRWGGVAPRLPPNRSHKHTRTKAPCVNQLNFVSEHTGWGTLASAEPPPPAPPRFERHDMFTACAAGVDKPRRAPRFPLPLFRSAAPAPRLRPLRAATCNGEEGESSTLCFGLESACAVFFFLSPRFDSIRFQSVFSQPQACNRCRERRRDVPARTAPSRSFLWGHQWMRDTAVAASDVLGFRVAFLGLRVLF